MNTSFEAIKNRSASDTFVLVGKKESLSPLTVGQEIGVILMAGISLYKSSGD